MKQITFPRNFVWGTSTTAIQIEGSGNARGRTMWDVDNTISQALSTPFSGSAHIDHLHEDVLLLQKLGIETYNFSLSWSRIFPEATGQANSEAVSLYDKLIDSLLHKGITPRITLYGQDMPLPLQKNGGWLLRDTANYFADFAGLIVQRFSDRILHWTTLHDPATELNRGYLLGTQAPGYFETDLLFVAAHNMLLAHAAALSAVHSASGQCKAGLSLSLNPPKKTGFVPAPIRSIAKDYLIHLFLDPVFLGRYPSRLEGRIFRQNKANLQPRDLEHISHRPDFITVLHKGFTYIRRSILGNYLRFQETFSPMKSQDPGAMIFVETESLLKLTSHLKKRYANPLLYISPTCALTPAHESGLTDHVRTFFYRKYIEACHQALHRGVNIGGFFAHPFLDCFEFDKNEPLRSGIVHVDFQTYERKIKSSANWYSGVCKNNGFKP